MKEMVGLEEVKEIMVENAIKFIVENNEVWTDWDNSIVIPTEYNGEKDGKDYRAMYEEQNDVDIWQKLDRFEVYQEALDRAKENFQYRLILAQSDKFEDIQSADVWYGNDKNKIAEKAYDDYNGFEFSKIKYTVDELSNMVEDNLDFSEQLEEDINISFE